MCRPVRMPSRGTASEPHGLRTTFSLQRQTGELACPEGSFLLALSCVWHWSLYCSALLGNCCAPGGELGMVILQECAGVAQVVPQAGPERVLATTGAGGHACAASLAGAAARQIPPAHRELPLLLQGAAMPAVHIGHLLAIPLCMRLHWLETCSLPMALLCYYVHVGCNVFVQPFLVPGAL